jgi:hypothetical protein
VLWIVPAFTLFLRFRRKQSTYLRRFPPVDRNQTLDMYTPWAGNPPGAYRRITEAMWRRRDDPELEQLLRDLWRGYGFVALWTFGFPLLTIAAIVILSLSGHPLNS